MPELLITPLIVLANFLQQCTWIVILVFNLVPHLKGKQVDVYAEYVELEVAQKLSKYRVILLKITIFIIILVAISTIQIGDTMANIITISSCTICYGIMIVQNKMYFKKFLRIKNRDTDEFDSLF